MLPRILSQTSKTRFMYVSHQLPIRNSLMSSSSATPTIFPSYKHINQSIRSITSWPVEMDEYEMKIYEILTDKLEPRSLNVRDISGGCGSMFAITVESEKFKGLTMIKQHRLVNEILKNEIEKWHGLQLKTKVAR